jgi:hypothetical protein
MHVGCLQVKVTLPKRYILPNPREAFFAETFNENPDWEARWRPVMDAGKYTGSWKVERGLLATGIPGDVGLLTAHANRHHAIVGLFEKPWVVTDRPFVIQLRSVRAFVCDPCPCS